MPNTVSHLPDPTPPRRPLKRIRRDTDRDHEKEGAKGGDGGLEDTSRLLFPPLPSEASSGTSSSSAAQSSTSSRASDSQKKELALRSADEFPIRRLDISDIPSNLDKAIQGLIWDLEDITSGERPLIPAIFSVSMTILYCFANKFYLPLPLD